jgi:DNA gyrase/topoisomerase IV subunit B
MLKLNNGNFVDMHPEQNMPGVEVILTQLHSGGKFSNKNYQFSSGLHGVGVSVVNALSTQLDVEIKRNGKVYQMQFAGGEKQTELSETGSVGKLNTGSMVHFMPDAKLAFSHIFRQRFRSPDDAPFNRFMFGRHITHKRFGRVKLDIADSI